MARRLQDDAAGVGQSPRHRRDHAAEPRQRADRLGELTDADVEPGAFRGQGLVFADRAIERAPVVLRVRHTSTYTLCINRCQRGRAGRAAARLPDPPSDIATALIARSVDGSRPEGRLIRTIAKNPEEKSQKAVYRSHRAVVNSCGPEGLIPSGRLRSL